MRSLLTLCKPRKNFFDKRSRDVTLDISDLIDDKINPKEFFEENYLTEGMKVLFGEVFRRFSGKTRNGVITQTQSMGVERIIAWLLSLAKLWLLFGTC
ncbi:MAG: hypothetical protein WCK53_06820 [Methanomicrobiales archaeon]